MSIIKQNQLTFPVQTWTLIVWSATITGCPSSVCERHNTDIQCKSSTLILYSTERKLKLITNKKAFTKTPISIQKHKKKNKKVDLAKHILISKKQNNFSKPKPISLNANQFHLHEFIIK